MQGLLVLAVVACGAPSAIQPDEPPTVTEASLADVSPAQWATLRSRRVLFGHQSVGGNILEGVSELQASRPDVAIAVSNASASVPPSAPGVYHAKIGRNGDPGSKLAEFTALVDMGPPDMAVMKLCYLDADETTDPERLFASYASAMKAMQARHPGLTIVHVTMPLTADATWKGRLVNALRGRPSARDLNRKRSHFNARLRAEYAGREPVFDLARLESTRADGSRSVVVHRGEPVHFLAPEWTDDGGHLNGPGRRRVAEAFLAMLATH
jgi:hypothetical protein